VISLVFVSGKNGEIILQLQEEVRNTFRNAFTRIILQRICKRRLKTGHIYKTHENLISVLNVFLMLSFLPSEYIIFIIRLNKLWLKIQIFILLVCL